MSLRYARLGPRSRRSPSLAEEQSSSGIVRMGRCRNDPNWLRGYFNTYTDSERVRVPGL